MTNSQTALEIYNPIIKQNWQEKKRELKEKFPELIDPDLHFEKSKVLALINSTHYIIDKKLGKTEDEMLTLIQTL